MAINFCNLCGDPCIGPNPAIGNNNSQENWRTLVAQVLCGLQNTIVTPITPLPQIALSAEDLELEYENYISPQFLNGQNQLRRLRVNNTTDVSIDISLDGGDSTWLSVPAGEDTGMMDLGNVVLEDTNDFQIRITSGTATTGILYLQGSY